ncbi:MAG: hypothetical protein AABM42_10630 [Actinomycetota bacterium]
MFDCLQQLVQAADRSIGAVEQAGMLPKARFYSGLVSDTKAERGEYFERLWATTPIGSIIFFDPDNGLEVKSTPKGRRGSSKFLYLDELCTAGEGGRSVVVYQHFGRVERVAYVDTQLNRIHEQLPRHDLFALTGTHIAFLVAATKESSEPLRTASDGLQARWPGLQLLAFGR